MFTVHKLNDEGMAKARLIAADFEHLLEQLERVCNGPQGGGREMSIVKTKLQEACFFAKRAMAQQQQNQQT